jgi:mono/diheme cytochrome c family protein
MSSEKIRREHSPTVPGAVLTLALFAFTAAIGGCASPGEVSVSRAEYLYAENCAACHGATGDGRGPMAMFLEVRPRDFRNEAFRYVSTPGGPPTREDLLQSIRDGRTLGQMPAFPYLDHEDVTLLADLVRTMRRTGIARTLTEEFTEEGLSPEEIDEIAGERVAAGEGIEIPSPGPGFRPDTGRGRRLYMDNCASCHGPTGRGDGLDLPKDEQGNPIVVQDITSGRYSGGTRPREVFKRIRCGVPGTPMPESIALSDEEVWQLVRYVELLAGRR